MLLNVLIFIELGYVKVNMVLIFGVFVLVKMFVFVIVCLNVEINKVLVVFDLCDCFMQVVVVLVGGMVEQFVVVICVEYDSNGCIVCVVGIKEQ